MDDLKEIKLFLYTVEEYKRFMDYFSLEKNHSLTDSFSKDEYIAIQTKLIILRKFGSKPEKVYIEKILNTAVVEFPAKTKKFSSLLSEYKEMSQKQLQSILADGTKLTLYETIEDVMYGLYLHADEARIKRLVNTDPALCFVATREYVESLEKVVIDTYSILTACIAERYEMIEYEKAPVIFLGNEYKNEQKINGSPFWSNLYGTDASEIELKRIIGENSLEDNKIILICTSFMEEVRKDDYSVEKLENLVFPPTRRDWEDFSKLHRMCKDIPNIGWSTKVRYNDTHDMAYVNIFRNVEGAFVIDQPHVIQDICVITLVHENDKYGWRIFQIGERAEKYKETLSVAESIKRSFSKKGKR